MWGFQAMSNRATIDATALPVKALSKDTIGLPGVIFVAIVSVAPAFSVCLAIPVGSLFAGGALPTSVLFAMVASLLVAVAMGQLAKHIPAAGGLATYIAEGVHPAAGFVAAWVYPFGYAASWGAAGLVIGNLLATSITTSTGTAFHVWWVAGTVFTIGSGGAINYFGIKFSARMAMLLGV